MVRRGSTVRVRQRALQSPRKTAILGICSVVAGVLEGLDGAVYGAFASRTPSMRSSRRMWRRDALLGRTLLGLGFNEPVAMRWNGAVKARRGRVSRAPSGNVIAVSILRRVPWRLVAVPALLGVALGISVANGQTGDAVIIAVLLAFGLILFGVAAFLGVRHRDRGRPGG
jgi:hypothetical protein